MIIGVNYVTWNKQRQHFYFTNLSAEYLSVAHEGRDLKFRMGFQSNFPDALALFNEKWQKAEPVAKQESEISIEEQYLVSYKVQSFEYGLQKSPSFYKQFRSNFEEILERALEKAPGDLR